MFIMIVHFSISTESQVLYIKRELQRRGLLCQQFAALPVDMSAGSRDLLLATAWLLNKEQIIRKFMERKHISPGDDDVLSMCQVSTEKLDVRYKSVHQSIWK
jgi:hypothetical protein